MEKLTPQQAFENLKTVFPWLMSIKRHAQCVCLMAVNARATLTTDKIEWGLETEYPSQWRPATTDDALHSLNGERIRCRSREFEGFLFGASRTDGGVIAFGITSGEESVWRADAEVHK